MYYHLGIFQHYYSFMGVASYMQSVHGLKCHYSAQKCNFPSCLPFCLSLSLFFLFPLVLRIELRFLYHLAISPVSCPSLSLPFYLFIYLFIYLFGNRVLLSCFRVLLSFWSWPWTCNTPALASQVTGITGVCHHTWTWL